MRIYCAVAAGLHIEQFPICLTLLKHVSHVSLHYSHHSQSTYLHPRVSVRPVDSTRTLVSNLSRSPLVVYRILCSSQNRVRALDRALTEPMLPYPIQSTSAPVPALVPAPVPAPGPGPGPGRCLPCRTRAELNTDPPQCYIELLYIDVIILVHLLIFSEVLSPVFGLKGVVVASRKGELHEGGEVEGE
jgi:hypothetical protein